MPNTLSNCKNCKYKFDFSKSAYCPSCGHEEKSDKGASQSTSSLFDAGPPVNRNSGYSGNQAGIASGMAALLKAQNKTTHAIRSLALYLFITITTSFCGLILIYAVPQFALLGALIVIAGFITSISVGISELNKSKP